jgi:hypothetical protein
MTRVPLVLCCVWLMLLGGFGSASLAERGRFLSVEIIVATTITPAMGIPAVCEVGQVSTATNPCGKGASAPANRESRTTTQSYSLTCNPTGGNLPLAASVCEDIRRYPATMLDPPSPKAYRLIHMCSGWTGYSRTMSVWPTVGQTTSPFGDELGGCFSRHAPYDALLLYATAITANGAALAAIEPGLRCIHDPSFLCIQDLQYAVRQAIAAAGRALAFDPGWPIFQDEIGTRSCTLRIGGPASAKRLSAQCSIDVQGLEKRSSTPTVVFTEEWPVAAFGTARHTWRVLLDGYADTSKPLSVTQSGAVPPTLWR